MRKIEVKKVGIKSAFKATIYFTSIPLAIMSFIGLIVATIGAIISNGAVLAVGIPYIILPFFMLGIYGLLSMLASLVYNMFSEKFGGLELTIVEKHEDAPMEYVTIPPRNY